jgi:hypothetical protein
VGHEVEECAGRGCLPAISAAAAPASEEDDERGERVLRRRKLLFVLRVVCDEIR